MTVVPFKEFDFAFTSLVAEKKPFVALFTAAKDENGDTWCPDCKTATPFIPEIHEVAEKRGLKFYIFETASKEEYKSPDFVMRTDKLINLKSIPTLALFNGSTFSKRL